MLNIKEYASTVLKLRIICMHICIEGMLFAWQFHSRYNLDAFDSLSSENSDQINLLALSARRGYFIPCIGLISCFVMGIFKVDNIAISTNSEQEVLGLTYRL